MGFGKSYILVWNRFHVVIDAVLFGWTHGLALLDLNYEEVGWKYYRLEGQVACPSTRDRKKFLTWEILVSSGSNTSCISLSQKCCYPKQHQCPRPIYICIWLGSAVDRALDMYHIQGVVILSQEFFLSHFCRRVCNPVPQPTAPIACSTLSDGGKEENSWGRRGDWGPSLAWFTFDYGFIFLPFHYPRAWNRLTSPTTSWTDP